VSQHHTLSKQADGSTKKEHTFFMNKMTGESSWEKPAVLIRHQSIENEKKARAATLPPSIEELLSSFFEKACAASDTGKLTVDGFWNVSGGDSSCVPCVQGLWQATALFCAFECAVLCLDRLLSLTCTCSRS